MDINTYITQGLALAKKDITTTENSNFSAIQETLFGGTPIASDQEFIDINTEVNLVTLPEEAVRGADPNRKNYGYSFNMKNIYGQYYHEETTLNAQNAQTRVMAEDIARPWSIQERLLYHAAKIKFQKQEEWKMAKEKLCTELLLTGQYETKNHGVQTFPVYNDLLNIDGATLFTNPAGVIANAGAAIVAKGGAAPNKMILSFADSLKLTASTAFQKLFDIKHYNGNNYNPAVAVEGLGFLGVVSIPVIGPVELYVYAGQYTNKDKTTGYYIPQGTAILYSNPIGAIGYTGLLVNNGSDYQARIGMKERFTAYSEKRGDMVDTKLESQTAPTPYIYGFNQFGIIKNIPSA